MHLEVLGTRTDRTGHGGLTEEVDVLPCDDLSVNRKDTPLIVTDFIETAGRNGTILKGCRAGQNSGFCCMHLYFMFTAVSYQMFFH